MIPCVRTFEKNVVPMYTPAEHFSTIPEKVPSIAGKDVFMGINYVGSEFIK